MRLDKALVIQKLIPTRAKAQDAIAMGYVSVDGSVITKNSFEVNETMHLKVTQPTLHFVSRAGFKLYDVLQPFAIDLHDRIVMDVGASTGGFSDVCLQAGAKTVYALDVGSDQMDPTLLQDPRLHNMEHINCRYLTKEMFAEPIDFACIDVSFISLKLILPAVLSCIEDGEVVALIKPQFEAGKAWIKKGGIVKDQKVHERILRDMHEWVVSLGYHVHHIRKSSMIGRDGNQEYVMHIKKTACTQHFDYAKICKAKIDQR